MMDVGQHPNIQLFTNSELLALSGKAGNFRARVLRKAPAADSAGINRMQYLAFRRVVVALFVVLFLFFLSCEKDTSPLKALKDPRTYTYTIDTLTYPTEQVMMYTIWGSSTQDVWVTGHSSGAAGTMFHYDGKAWKPVNLHINSGGQLYGVGDFYDFLGFSSTDIWAVGEVAGKTQGIHYNGLDWFEVGTRREGSLGSIWGSNPNDIWSCGEDKVYRFDGTDWVEFPVKLPHPEINFADMRGLNASDIYMICYKKDLVPPIDSTFYYLYHYNGQEWSIIDSTFITSTHPDPKFGFRLSVIDGQLYSAGKGIFKLVNNTWIALNRNRILSRVAGLYDNYIFASGLLGTIYFYNGINWFQLRPIPGFKHYIGGIWTDGSEVFFLAEDGWQSYVIHGK